MKNGSNLLVLFLGLCLPAFVAGQSGSTTLLVKTDMSCNWTLDGRPMGQLKADDSTVVPVSPGEHLIEGVAPDGVATVHTKVEVGQTEKAVDIQLKTKYDQQVKMQHADALSEKSGAALSPTWTDPSTDLMWTRKDNGSDVDWNQATTYCAKSQLAGYTDWRLPTIEELQGIYDPSVSYHAKFDYDLVVVHVKGHLNLTGWYWSSTPGEHPGRPWNFIFHHRKGESREGFPLVLSYSMRALCVRSGE